jgi:nicotinamidase/pyrazinamidase
MKNTKALIVVDVQNDFCPGGSLAVPEGDTIIPVINKLLSQFDLVIFTKDWHPANHFGFASRHKGYKPFMHLMVYQNSGGFGGTMDISEANQLDMGILWPDHCVQDTPGADFHKDLDLGKCKGEFYIFKKGMDIHEQGYSAFESPELASFLDGKGISELFICGLATDYCVKNTALDAVEEGFQVTVFKDACKGIAADLSEVEKELEENEIAYINS